MKRTPLRTRRPWRAWARDDDNKVTPQLRSEVIARDGVCFAARIDLSHQCRDRWGRPHRPDDAARLTLDHVHDAAMMGKRAPSDARHLVAACGWANNEGWCSAHRREERDYLASLPTEGDSHA